MITNINMVNGRLVMKNMIVLAIPSLLTYLMWIRWEFLLIWLIFVTFDIISGIIASRYNNTWKSHTMKQGLQSKSIEMILVLTVVFLQRLLQLYGVASIPIFEVLMVSMCYKEFGSVLENYQKCGKKVPEVLLKIFKITQSQINGKSQISKKEISKKEISEKGDNNDTTK